MNSTELDNILERVRGLETAISMSLDKSGLTLREREIIETVSDRVQNIDNFITLQSLK